MKKLIFMFISLLSFSQVFSQCNCASAGNDDWVCGNTTTLNAIVQNCTGNGYWSGPSNATFTNFNSPNTSVSLSSFTTNNTCKFVWHYSNNSSNCTDTVRVYFFYDEPALVNINPADTVSLSTTYTGLHAISPSNGWGIWIDTDYSTNFSNPFLLNPTVTVSSYGYHDFYWIIRNGVRPDQSAVCYDSSQVVRVNFINPLNSIITFSDNINLFPNPTIDFIELTSIPNSLVEIINVSGQIVETIKIAENKIKIDLSKLTNGVYTLKIISTDGINIKRLIKQ